MTIAATKLVQLLICEALPFAKMLLGEIVDRNRLWAGNPLGPGQANPDDRRRCLVGAVQIARHSDCAARQLLGQPGKTGSLRTIPRKVQLAIDPTSMVYRRVPDPSEAARQLAHFAAAVSSCLLATVASIGPTSCDGTA